MFKNDHDNGMTDLSSTMASVTASEWEDNIDNKASAAFAVL